MHFIMDKLSMSSSVKNIYRVYPYELYDILLYSAIILQSNANITFCTKCILQFGKFEHMSIGKMK